MTKRITVLDDRTAGEYEMGRIGSDAAMKIMIVDDSMVIRNRIERLCADARLPDLHVIGLAADGSEAIEIAQRDRPDLVTMDLTMPHMDGEACIESLAALLPEVRILVVSALSDKPTALRAIAKGAHGFLYKPFNDDQLVEAMLELMS
jgi:two-component system chemotaxis response regulator CheY